MCAPWREEQRTLGLSQVRLGGRPLEERAEGRARERMPVEDGVVGFGQVARRRERLGGVRGVERETVTGGQRERSIALRGRVPVPVAEVAIDDLDASGDRLARSMVADTGASQTAGTPRDPDAWLGHRDREDAYA